MPTIDALARESRVFTNAYIQASHSNYADLVPLSSQYPLRSPQMYEYPPNPTYPRVLIYDVLKALGYKTAIFSSQNERWGGMINFHRQSSLDRFFDAETFTGDDLRAVWRHGIRGVGQGNKWRRQRRRPLHGGRSDQVDRQRRGPAVLHSHEPSEQPPAVRGARRLPSSFQSQDDRLRDHVGKVSDREDRHRQGPLRGQPLLRGHADRASLRAPQEPRPMGQHGVRDRRRQWRGLLRARLFRARELAVQRGREGADDHPGAGSCSPDSTIGRRCSSTCRRRCSSCWAFPPHPGLPGDQPLRASTEPGSQPLHDCADARGFPVRDHPLGLQASLCRNGTDDISCRIR